MLRMRGLGFGGYQLDQSKVGCIQNAGGTRPQVALEVELDVIVSCYESPY